MSTRYGNVRLRGGGELAIEAFGATGCIKLTLVGTHLRPIVIDDPAEATKLISLLDVAYGHIWIDEKERGHG